MTKYELIATIIASIALVISLPNGILNIINIYNKRFKIKIDFESTNIIEKPETSLQKKNYTFDFRLKIKNTTETAQTIENIQILFDGMAKFCCMSMGLGGTAVFRNVKIEHSLSQHFLCDFDRLDFKKAILKINTARKSVSKDITEYFRVNQS